MSFKTLVEKYPEIKSELIKLQVLAGRELTEQLRNNSINSNSESSAFTRGVTFGKFSLLSELTLGVDMTNALVRKSDIELLTEVAQAQVPTEIKEDETLCNDCASVPCFCEEAINSKATDN
jgi:hypothetical protein